jgi:hypothetical protein
MSEFMDLLYVEDLLKDFPNDDQESSSSSDHEDDLRMDQVRFNSCCILPSHIKSCKFEQKAELGLIAYVTDFLFLKTLSWGAYGRVVLSRKKDTKDLFAIKVMDKSQMV